jgi:hypothetical protein
MSAAEINTSTFVQKQLIKKVAFFYAILLQFIPLLQIIVLSKIHSK